MTEMTEGDITRATFWIRRWKLLGGGFAVNETDEQLEIETARQADPDEKPDDPRAVAAAALMLELAKDGRKQRHVLELVRLAHEAREKRESDERLAQAQEALATSALIEHAPQADNDTDDPPSVA